MQDRGTHGNYPTDMHPPPAATSVQPLPMAAQPDWTTLLAQHDRWLRTVAFARLREYEAVNDVMQEVALAAVRQQAPLADFTKVAPWLYRLTVTQTLLYRRKMGRGRKLLARFCERIPHDGVSQEHDALAWLLADERQKLVRTAMTKIPRRDAEILLLKYSEDWSYHQIAAHLGLTHAAVETRLHRARIRLRREIEHDASLPPKP